MTPNYVSAQKDGGPLYLYPMAVIKQSIRTQIALTDMAIEFDSDTDWLFADDSEAKTPYTFGKIDFECNLTLK